VLEYLRVRGLALLDDVALELHRGMNVLTGETGAGKSIIIDALTLVRGARGRGELVREGESSARVESQFWADDSVKDRLVSLLDEHGLELDEEAGLVIERVVSRGGRGRSVVQGSLTTQAVLGRIGEHLIDVCSQHEHHSLTSVSRHLELLDAYADVDDLLADYEDQYAALKEVRAAHEAMAARSAESVQRADYLRFQIDELERVAPEEGERDALAARVELMREAHRWRAFAHEARESLYEADDAIAGRIAALLDATRRRAPESSALSEIEEQLEVARIACEEAADAAVRLAEEVELEPQELEDSQERLHELDRVARKHGCDADELAERLASMREELEALENLDDHLTALADRQRELERRCLELADRLHGERERAARRLGEAVEAELGALHMPDARLEARVQRLAEDQLGPRGLDRVELAFSANAGEPLGSLSKVASGGELSRVLLAIKGVLATGDQVATYVFDEVDAGVGGAVAEAIGRRLHRAARERQVLCITHLPQIAAFADAHYRVEKRSEGGRTVTRVVRLEDEARVEELARMLGGARVTASARKHAQELLAHARGKAGPGGRSRGRARARG
jgi:DNA repair protein RecN (Recombination protein N)